MMVKPALVMPVFRKLKPQPAARERRPGACALGRPQSIPDSVVAAIRWDYDDGLMRVADIQAKYAGKVSGSYVAAICYRLTRPDVKAKRGQA